MSIYRLCSVTRKDTTMFYDGAMGIRYCKKCGQCEGEHQ